MKKVSPNGFTLVELMIVVAIVGILAAVAIISYRKYIESARKAEASGILSDIRLKQEAYRATFHQYACTAPNCLLAPVRAAASAWTTRAQWPAASLALTQWNQLGMRPDSGLWYSYGVVAGLPGGTAPPAPYNLLAIPTVNDFWYGAMAFADFDGDGSFSCMSIKSGTQILQAYEEGVAICGTPGP